MFLNDPKTVAVDVVGELTKRSYAGVFKIKPLLSHRDRLQRDEFKRQLLGSNSESNVSQEALKSALIFSKIWVHTIESPSWWKDSNNGLDLIDEEPVVALLDKILGIEIELVGKTEKEAESAKKELTDIAAKKE
jgi:hypothetical protein